MSRGHGQIWICDFIRGTNQEIIFFWFRIKLILLVSRAGCSVVLWNWIVAFAALNYTSSPTPTRVTRHPIRYVYSRAKRPSSGMKVREKSSVAFSGLKRLFRWDCLAAISFITIPVTLRLSLAAIHVSLWYAHFHFQTPLGRKWLVLEFYRHILYYVSVQIIRSVFNYNLFLFIDVSLSLFLQVMFFFSF